MGESDGENVGYVPDICSCQKTKADTIPTTVTHTITHTTHIHHCARGQNNFSTFFFAVFLEISINL